MLVFIEVDDVAGQDIMLVFIEVDGVVVTFLERI